MLTFHQADAGQLPSRTLQPFVLAALLMTVVLHSLAAAARLPVEFVLSVLEAVLYGAFVFSNVARPNTLTTAQAEVLGTIPRTMDTVMDTLKLKPNIIRYACCPKCYSTYAPNPSKTKDKYPSICTFRETDKPECGEKLVEKVEHVPTHKTGQVQTTYEPLLIFPFLQIASWLGDILQRPGLKATMTQAWSRTRPRDTPWLDIFDAEALRGFLGPDGKTLFSEQPDGSLHLVFSLFVDWFNPYGNKKAGKSHSIGAIYLVCMNLPQHLRYRPENIYLVGIIPGPKEPELHQINNLLRPLVEELLILWNRGMYFSGATAGEAGLLVRAALIPLVCDIPALRKTGGFAGHMSSHFCSFCELPKDDINDLDRASWPRRTWEQHLHQANQWHDAKTESERVALFKKHGLRWSELLRLPYWDPTRFAVVDAMHNLFLGELRHHCRDVWGLDVKDKGGDGPKMDPHTPQQQYIQIQRVHSALLKRSKTALRKIRKGYLTAVAELNEVVPSSDLFTKEAYITALITWVST